MNVDKRTLYNQITKSSIINTFIINRIIDPSDENINVQTHIHRLEKSSQPNILSNILLH